MASSLLQRGPIKLSSDHTYLTYADGTPFFWLADTWWYGLTDRATWSQPFQTMVKDRQRKGFSVIQVVVGVPPEIPLDSAEAKCQGEHPWTQDGEPNPLYFKAIEPKIRYLVDHGIVPCLFGGWGPQITQLGYAKVARFWQETVRYFGRYPVVWCVAGEVDMALPLTLDNTGWNLILKKLAHWLPVQVRHAVAASGHSDSQIAGWSKIGTMIHQLDDHRHLITAHPHIQRTAAQIFAHPSWLDINTIQSGHSHESAAYLVSQALESSGQGVFINLEPWYEGIRQDFYAKHQRYAFWMSVLAGAKGHTYGADGLWNMRTREQPFLSHWGQTDWQTALNQPGSTQLGLAKRWLALFPWWQLRPQLDWLTPVWTPDSPNASLVASLTSDQAIIYIPDLSQNQSLGWSPSGQWKITVINPITCLTIGSGQVNTKTGTLTWQLQQPTDLDDVVLLLEKTTPTEY